MDGSGQLLSTMRLSGGVILDAEFRGQWAINASFSPEACSQFFPVRGSLISYHYVREGALSVDADGEVARDVGPGSILIFPGNHHHRLFNADVEALYPDDYIMPPEDDGPATLRLGEGDPLVRIYCGFLSAVSHRNPVLDRLPPVVVLQPDGPSCAWIDASMRFAAEAAHNDPSAVGKLAELMFAQAIRIYLDGDEDARRLAAALADPPLARALDYIHANFASDVDVEAVAREAGLSRTVLGERFVAVMGEPPIRYCARYRMRRAAELLEAGSSAAEAGYAVGFTSDAAFARAFKREYGKPPAEWARETRSG